MPVHTAVLLGRRYAAVAACLLAACSNVAEPVRGALENTEAETTSVLLTEGTNLAVAVSPVNGDKVIALQAALYLQKAGEKSARALTDWDDDAWEPSFHPDGGHIVYGGYREGSFDLWKLNPYDGSKPVPLTRGAFDDREPQYSADGQRIIFSSDRSGSYDLWQLHSSEGDTPPTEPEPLKFLDTDAHSPTWHPDGNGFAYLVTDRGGSAIYWQRPDADAELLLQSRSRFSGLRFLPGGAALSLRMLDRDPAGNALGDLYLWDIEQQKLSQITDDPAAEQTPVWSQDGKRLSWISDKHDRYAIWTLDLATGAIDSLVFETKFISFPAWSPCGSKLAFFTDVPANPLLHVVGQLSIYDLETGELSAVLAPMPPQPINWSADGRYLVTTRLKPYSQRFREGIYAIVAANVDTGEAHDIVPTPHRSLTHATLAPRGDGSHQVAYSQNGVLNLQVLDGDMRPVGAPQVLVNALADMPSFSHSGEYLAYLAGDQLFRRHLLTGQREEISPDMTWRRDVPDRRWVLRAGRLFDGTSESYTQDVDITVDGHRIQSIGPINTATALPVLDASDSTVIPGLFESHAHIGDHNHSEQQGRAWLAYGITSVRDPGSNPYLANERREAWASGRRIGPRTFITGHNIDGNRVYYAVAEGIASDAHLEKALQRSRALDVDFIKTYVRLSDRRQRRIVDFAHSIGVPVTSHELLPAAAYGVDYVEHFTGTSRRGFTTKISELGRSYQDVVAVLSETGMGIVPTMVVPGVVLTFTEQNDLYSTEQFNALYGEAAKKNYQDFMAFFGPGSGGYVDAYGELLSELVARGALVGTGTDSPFTPFGTGLHAELRLYQREGLKGYQILQAATLQYARIAGADKDLGSIEAGKLADMVIINGDPLADISDITNIRGTVKNGRYYSLADLLYPSH